MTLISSNEGYPAGALAIAAALEVLESELRRIALVTQPWRPASVSFAPLGRVGGA